MRVGVSTLHARHRPGEGAAEYFLRRLIAAARAVQSDVQFVIFTHDGSHDRYEGWDRLHVPGAPGRALMPARRLKAEIADAMRRANADVLLAPLDSAPVQPPVPRVLYAFEMPAEEGVPENAGRAALARIKAVKNACAAARAVLTASEQLRRYCLKRFETPMDRVIVTPAGVDPVFEEARPPMLDQPYFVLFHDSLTHDQTPMICDTLGKRRSDFPHAVVVVGAVCGPEPEHWGPNTLRIEQCPDRILATLYQHATAFIYPGARDGGGLRILEALRAGTLVIAPHNDAFDEIAGDTPFYYNSASLASFVQTLRRALDLDPEKRKQRIHLGQMLATKFTWEKSAWKLIAALRRTA